MKQALNESPNRYPWNISSSTSSVGDFYIKRKGNKAGEPTKNRESSSDFAVVVDDQQLNSKYFFYVIQHLYQQGMFKPVQTGAVISGIRKEDINRVILDFFSKHHSR